MVSVRDRESSSRPPCHEDSDAQYVRVVPGPPEKVQIDVFEANPTCRGD